MSETKFDNIIEQEEKKNAFDKARESVKGADEPVEQRPVIKENANIDVNSIFDGVLKKAKMENQTYYIKSDNAKKIQKIAKLQGLSSSKVMDKILDNLNI